jgi:hypothetical protein
MTVDRLWILLWTHLCTACAPFANIGSTSGDRRYAFCKPLISFVIFELSRENRGFFNHHNHLYPRLRIKIEDWKRRLTP